VPNISIKKATLINAVSKYSTVVLNIFFTAILSRILTPADYGIVAIVTVFTPFFSVLANLGMGTAVIQDKTLTDIEVNHIFTFSLYIALGFAALFCLFGFFVAWFYQNTVYIPICFILSVSLFFNTVNMIPDAILLKEKRFLLLGIRLIVVNIVTYSITVILALYGFKYYTLVIQSVFSALFILIWNLKNAKLRLVLKIDFCTIKKIREYSGYQFGFSFINYFSRNLDKLVIGKVMGNVLLAQYDKAYRLMLYPLQNITWVITPSLHPIISEHQYDKEWIYQRYIRIIKFLSLLGVFVTAVCFWCSEESIILVFGDQWYEAVGCFKWLSLSVWVQIINGSAGSIYQSIGNTKLMFQSGICHVAIMVVSIILGILTRDLVSFSLIVSIGFIIRFLAEYFFLIKKGLNKSFRLFLLNFIPECVIFICLFSGSYFFSQYIYTFNLSLIVTFVCKFCFILIIYFLCLVVTKQWEYVKKIIL
jgi:PST family polysaccharide transporter